MTGIYEEGEGQTLNEAPRAVDPRPPGPGPLLFRPRYRTLTAEEVANHDAIKAKANELAQLIAALPVKPGVYANAGVLANITGNQGANVALSLRHLEDCVMRAVMVITA